MFTPDSYVKLCTVPMSDNKNQLHFTTKELQYDYFEHIGGEVVQNCTYFRQDSSIKLNYKIDDLYQYNYIIYQNTNFSSKLFMSFTTRLQYVSTNVTKIYIKTDVIHTWLFDYKVLP